MTHNPLSRVRRTALSTVLLLAATAIFPTSATATPPPQEQGGAAENPYEHRAARWFQRNGIETDPLPDLEDLYELAFVRVDLGAFEVLVPDHALTDRDWIESIQEVTGALLDAQVEWASWLPRDAEPGDADGSTSGFDASLVSRNAATLAKWIRTWKQKTMRKALARVASSSEEEGPKPLREILDAPERVLVASEELAKALRNGASLGGPLEASPRACRLILLPTREDFVEFQAVVALLEPRHRPYFWVEGVEFWTVFDYDGNRAIALSFATDEALRHYERAIAMNRKNANEMAENVVQLAMQSLLGHVFGERMDPILAGGIANDLVISQFGEVDTRTDGDLRSKSIAARSVFVPGGNPDGGTLPPVDAQSRWRARRGKGYFADALSDARKDAAKEAKEAWQKRAGFLLKSDDESSHIVVTAPFLGPAATALPPEEFRGDQAEFLRAYRACFLHWLRENGAGSKAASREAYGMLLRKLATSEQSFPDLVTSIYGAPLSAPSGPELFEGGDAEPLEGRFLRWLGKH
ncbi:MAG TPA: hypothetical protein ENJ09_15990 [Planctomycetes bacterium]|nr:hypothetical protein [Planctomycetota bacterium]